MMHQNKHSHTLLSTSDPDCDHLHVEDDSINFWATLGVSPHAVSVADLAGLNPQQPPPSLLLHADPHPTTAASCSSSLRGELLPLDDLEPHLGMEFVSGEAAKTFYIAYAGRVGFSVRIARSRRSKCSESTIMLRFVCSREGFSKEKLPASANGKRTRKRAASIREGCKAMLEVVRRASDGKWSITKLIKEHSHQIGSHSRVHYIATEGNDDANPYIGMEFVSLDTAKSFYYSYASRIGFEVRVRQSRRSLHDESLKMLKLVCSKHRYHCRRDTAEVATISSSPWKEVCNALFEVIKKESGTWVVSKLVLDHTHELDPPSLRKVQCIRSQGDILVIAKKFSDTRDLLLSSQEHSVREILYNELEQEDARSLLEYFENHQAENPAFFFAIQADRSDHITNIFWADARACISYLHFGDAVQFDVRYRHRKDMIPIVLFSGTNHHAQPVVFGCALLVDESEASFCWLFDTWLRAMRGSPPVSLVTELNHNMATAAAKVLPRSRHVFCRKHVLQTVEDELGNDLCFKRELLQCIDESEIVESFETNWVTIVRKYCSSHNSCLQLLYEFRDRWVPAYTKDAFLTEALNLDVCEFLDTVDSIHFTMGTPLKVAVQHLLQEIATRAEKEVQADYEMMFEKPVLRTRSPIEKQAGDLYTRVIFERFQREFIESFSYFAEKVGGDNISEYHVSRIEGGGDFRVISFCSDNSKPCCSCQMFESCGILCRHAIRVCMVEGVRQIPTDCILKRWTKHAKSGDSMVGVFVDLRRRLQDPSVARYDDLCSRALLCAKEGAVSVELYFVAKDAIQRAVNEVLSAKQPRRAHQTLTERHRCLHAGKLRGIKRSASRTLHPEEDDLSRQNSDL